MSAPAAGPLRAGKSLWFPDLALCLSVFTLLYCLFVFDGWRQLFRDSDTGWHIRTGEAILTTQHLPVSDPYSFTRSGERWFAWEWASDVAMGAAHRRMGLAGVALLFAVAIAAATFLWVRLNWQAGTDFLLVCVSAIPMLSTANLHWLARPHVFGWLCLLAALLFASRSHVTLHLPGALGVAALSIAWTNLHASFFLFPAILILFACGRLIENVLLDTRHDSVRPLIVYAGIASTATLVNPFGWQVHQHVLRYLLNSELLDRVGEFQTFNFHVEGAWQIVLLMGWIALGGSLALTQGKIAEALLIAGLLALALRSARGLPIAALAALPFASAAVTAALRNGMIAGLRPALQARIGAALQYSQRLRMLDERQGGWILVVPVFALATLAALGSAKTAGFPRDQFPVEAADAVAKLPVAARLLAPDKFGGYLIYRFAGERKVFFDGRSDFYGSDFMKRYIKLIEVRPGWREELASWQFSHALLPNQYSLIPALQQLGWKTIHRDSVATLLAKEGARE